MGNPIKKAIFDYQLHKCRKDYEARKEYLSDPYMRWMEENEAGFEKYCKGAGPDEGSKCHKETGENQRPDSRGMLNASVSYLSVAEFNAVTAQTPLSLEEEWLCVVGSKGEVSPYFAGMLGECLFEHPESGLVYGDEDIYDPALSGGSAQRDKNGIPSHIKPFARYGPWFKPDESPETLLSYFYYGSVVLLKTSLVKEALRDFSPVYSLSECTDRQYFYDFILHYTDFLMLRELEIFHIPQIIFHGKGFGREKESLKKPEPVNENAYWGYEPEYDACKLNSLKRRGLMAKMRHYSHSGRRYSAPVYEVMENPSANEKPLISVIIPSKDNVSMLKLCIDSIKNKSSYPSYGLIVVDNGSNEENRRRLEQMASETGFSYLYEPMEFHFSQMCNLGAKAAKGDYFLFLNDDMEAVSGDFFEILAGQASCSQVGAVGAKLLYPGSDLIQHVGISNIAVGPVHKLQKAHDGERDYYYGRNTLPINVIGVTAACLMVKKERFYEAGEFPLEAAVSYNDVELCFSLREHGYRSVVRNDVVLYHHESVSRGDDRMDDEKWERLLREKDGVYKRHPGYAKNDPYYNKNLSGFKPQFFCSWLYPYERRECFSQLSVYKKRIREEWYNNCVTVTLEHIGLERRLWREEKDNCYQIEGWSYVLNMDNSRYKRHLLLTDEKGMVYEAALWERFRSDVVEILSEQENIALSGFCCRILEKSLKPGKYRISLLYEDCCSRQRLYKECEEILYVGKGCL